MLALVAVAQLVGAGTIRGLTQFQNAIEADVFVNLIRNNAIVDREELWGEKSVKFES